MSFELIIKKEAQADLVKLFHNEPKAFNKAQQLLEELKSHPRTGTGHPEQLKGEPRGRWSRRITQKHSLVYEILDDEVIVFVITAYGHYSDK